jgi:hypothetical protein
VRRAFIASVTLDLVFEVLNALNDGSKLIAGTLNRSAHGLPRQDDMENSTIGGMAASGHAGRSKQVVNKAAASVDEAGFLLFPDKARPVAGPGAWRPELVMEFR